jgi:hypothetical protein
MKRSLITCLMLGAGLLSAGSLSSCMMNCVSGSGHQATETRKATQDFTRLEVSGSYRVILKQDSSNKITITADDNIIKYIKTKDEDGTLRIYNNKSICNGGDMIITIGVKDLESIRGSGATEFTAQGKLICKDMEFHMSGSSHITLELNAANVTYEGSGNSELDLTGQATSCHIDISGSGRVGAYGFVVSDYEIGTSGSSNCEINVLHSLHVSSSGSSEIKYKGNPTDVSNDKSGSSSLEKVD